MVADEPQSSAEYCRNLVRHADRDRYLASLFAPDDQKIRLWSLYAFNLEIARVRELVSDPQLGEMRFQWWREVIDGIYAGEVLDHPVAVELATTIKGADLPRHAFVNLIEARTFDLYDDPMPALSDLEGYLGETSSALMQLAALSLAGPDAIGAAEASGYAGVAYGLTGLLRALPIHRARGQCYIPVDLLEKRGTTTAQVLSGRRDASMSVVLTELQHLAARRLQQARDCLSHVPLAALPAFLPTCLIDGYLAKMSKSLFNPLKQTANVSQVRRQIRLLSCSFREEF